MTCAMGDTIGPNLDEHILIVDDDERLISGITRQLEENFTFHIAHSGTAALEKVRRLGPFAVVISDYRMPGMDGYELLTEVMKIHPDTRRILLTAHADIHLAVNLVNEIDLFRLLLKPCSTENIEKALSNAIKGYRQARAEYDLLHKTLFGSVQALMDILSIVDPIGFSAVSRTREIVQKLSQKLELPTSFELELAAMLSQIGTVTIPTPILAQIRTGAELTDVQRMLMNKVPEFSKSLLEKIPRLEVVAEIIGAENQKGFNSEDEGEPAIVPLSGNVLKLAHDFVYLEGCGVGASKVIATLSASKDSYHPRVWKALEMLSSSSALDLGKKSSPQESSSGLMVECEIGEVAIGSTLGADVYSIDGVLLLCAGTVVTSPLLLRLKNYDRFIGLRGSIMLKKQG